MQHAVSAETERKTKLGLITTQNKVNEVSAKDEKSAKSKTDPLIAAIDALKTEVSTLKSEVRELRASKQAGMMHNDGVNQKCAPNKSHPASCQMFKGITKTLKVVSVKCLMMLNPRMLKYSLV